MLTVVFGCKRFHTYVYGKEFVVESDHKPLKMISLKKLISAPPRLHQMLLEIHGYDHTIKYHPGREITLADGLSWLPNKSKNTQADLDLKIQFLQFSTEKMTELKEESRKDPEIAAPREVITEGWPDKVRELPSPLKSFWSFRDELAVEDSLVLKGERIFIPQTLRSGILKRIHMSHQGIEKCKLRARTCVYWPSLKTDIEGVTRGCEICQEYHLSQPKETLMPHEIPSRPWQVIASDLFFLEGKNYMLVSDYYSKFNFVRKMSAPCVSQVVVKAMKEIFSEHGVPEKVISDNGRYYDCETFKEFAKWWGFDHITSSPTFAQSNGH